MKELIVRLQRALLTMQNDDLSAPSTEKRLRHIERSEAICDAIEFLTPLVQRFEEAKPDQAALEGMQNALAFIDFVNLWVNRENVTDAERVSVIKHHPIAQDRLRAIAALKARSTLSGKPEP